MSQRVESGATFLVSSIYMKGFFQVSLTYRHATSKRISGDTQSRVALGVSPCATASFPLFTVIVPSRTEAWDQDLFALD